MLRSRLRIAIVQCRWQSTQAKESVRWFYATDIPLAKPAYFHYKPTQEAKNYVPFTATDSARLENEYWKQAMGKLVPIKEDQLFQVDLSSRELSPVYWEGPIYAVRRGTWFYSNNVPCKEDLAKEIEQIRNGLDKKHDETKSYNLGTMKSGRVKFAKDRNTAWVTSDDAATFKKLTNFGGTKLSRGYKEGSEAEKKSNDDGVFSAVGSKIENIMDPKAREQNTEKSMEVQIKYDYNTGNKTHENRDIDHLVLCVHGIGQRLSQKIESVNFVHDINVFRKLLREVFTKREELQHLVYPSHSLKKDKPLRNNRVQVLPVLWRHDIKFDMTKDDAPGGKHVTLEDITIDGVTALRSIVGDVILDVLLYHQPHYKQQIIQAVVYQLNKIVREFAKRNGKMPKISLVGHSLGSAIVHDILGKENAEPSSSGEISREALEFTVENYFAVGSPLGLFRLLEKDQVTRTSAASTYNIFHPCDPVAYRIEPLISTDAAQLQPAVVPYVQGGLKTQLEDLSELGHKISASANSIWANIYMPWTKPVGQQPQEPIEAKEDKVSAELRNQIECELTKLNPSGRVDYVLQEGVLDISLIAAIASHMSYFENEDVASFVLKSLYS